ncbi:hypothetical protein D3C85_902320 [compost metagenome]
MSFNEPPVLLNGTPSTTTNGPVPAVIEFWPRIEALGWLPGTEEPLVIFTPATAPCTACKTLVTGSCDKRSFESEATAPVISERFCVP